VPDADPFGSEAQRAGPALEGARLEAVVEAPRQAEPLLVVGAPVALEVVGARAETDRLVHQVRLAEVDAEPLHLRARFELDAGGLAGAAE